MSRHSKMLKKYQQQKSLSQPICPMSADEFVNKCMEIYIQPLSESEIDDLLESNKIDKNDKSAVADFKENYAIQSSADEAMKSLDNLLEGNGDSINYFNNLCNFSEENYQYITEKQGDIYPEKLVEFISLRLKDIPSLNLITQISCDTFNSLVMINSEHKPSSFELEKNVQKLEHNAQYLPDFMKAKTYYLAAQSYQSVNSSPYEATKASSEEVYFLNKALSCSQDFSLISSIQKRLGKNIDSKSLIAAYKRTLDTSDDNKLNCRINYEIAKIYEGRSKIAGFSYPNSEKEKSLTYAEFYYKESLAGADDDSKLLTLKNIATIQSLLGHKNDWVETKTEIAMNYLKDFDRCKALIKIASHLPKKESVFYYEKTIEEAQKAELKNTDKNSIIRICLGALEQMGYNPKKIENLRNSLNHLPLENSSKLSAMDILKKYPNNKSNSF